MASYGYDSASEMTSVAYANGATTLGTLGYGYDAASRVSARSGSLFASALPNAVTSSAYDSANRLTSRVASGVTQQPVWDANGSLASDGVDVFGWDARNRLTSIGPSGALGAFVYDGLGRRQSATLNGKTTSYLYAGDDVVQELQGGAVSASELDGLSTDERFSRAGETYLTDLLGSTVALASGATIQTHYGYDPYGAAQAPIGAATTNPFGFTGRENDGGPAGLMYYRARYYNPAWGRFVSEDPIGIAGGVNLYGYVGGNPIDGRDPSGLQASAACVLGGPVDPACDAGIIFDIVRICSAIGASWAINNASSPTDHCYKQHELDVDTCFKNYSFNQSVLRGCIERADTNRDLCIRGLPQVPTWKDPDVDGVSLPKPPRKRK